MKKLLDEKERVALLFVDSYTKANGAPPTIREIAEELGCAKSHAYVIVHQLVSEGLLFHKPNVSRMLTITEAGRITIAQLRKEVYHGPMEAGTE